MRVALVCMPYMGLERPAIGISLLKAYLARAGVPCDVHYLNWRLAEHLGFDDYAWVGDWHEVPHEALAGEWTFTSALYGDRPAEDAAFAACLRDEWGLPAAAVDRLAGIRDRCRAFVDEVAADPCWDAYDLVGFTSTFEQNLASLALARRLKERRPERPVVFGGANWEEPMGAELHRCFPFVDYSCSGEADESFPALVAALATGGDVGAIPGLVHRVDGEPRSTGRAPLVARLDDTPIPDYDDFFAARAASPVADRVQPVLLLQTARGCWWGEKHHCTFCGLNSGTMAFRSKSPERVAEEIDALVDRYGVRTVDTVDEILDMRYLRTLLPELARRGPRAELFYEIKANLGHDQVATLAAAGVTSVQPGLESLSDHVLTLMDKGTTALRNVQLLKWCREHGITVYWNLLYGIPGETEADYAETADLIRRIWFLDPPSGGAVRLRLDRYSPYHADPERFGLRGVRASSAYRHLYPVDGPALDRIAYYFDFDYDPPRPRDAYVGEVAELVDRWRADTDRGDLVLTRLGGGAVELRDTRPGAAAARTVLDGWRAEVYEACGSVRRPDEVRRLGEAAGAAPAAVDAFLAGCAEAGTMVVRDDGVLALAVHSPACAAPDPEPSLTGHTGAEILPAPKIQEARWNPVSVT